MDFSEFNARYQSDLTDCALETLAVRAGQVRTAECEHAEPMYLSSSYVFNSAAEAEARFLGEVKGNVYSRYTNPTVRTLEDRLAAMEGAEACVATASGMAAIYATCIAHLESGDHLICSSSVFGSTVKLFDAYLAKFNIEVEYADLLDADDWKRKVKSNTKMLYLESPSNPVNDIADIRVMSEIAHDAGA